MDQGTACAVKKTADQASGSTGLVDATDLIFPVLANTDYIFEYIVAYRTAATTTGLKLGINGPSGSTVTFQVLVAQTNSAAGTTNMATECFNALDGAILTLSVDAANTDRIARIHGVMRVAATPGNLALRFASEINASNVTIRKGSGGFLF